VNDESVNMRPESFIVSFSDNFVQERYIVNTNVGGTAERMGWYCVMKERIIELK